MTQIEIRNAFALNRLCEGAGCATMHHANEE